MWKIQATKHAAAVIFTVSCVSREVVLKKAQRTTHYKLQLLFVFGEWKYSSWADRNDYSWVLFVDALLKWLHRGILGGWNGSSELELLCLWSYSYSSGQVKTLSKQILLFSYHLCVSFVLRRRAQSWMPWPTRPGWRSKSWTLCLESSATQSKEQCMPSLRSSSHHEQSRKLRSAFTL